MGIFDKILKRLRKEDDYDPFAPTKAPELEDIAPWYVEVAMEAVEEVGVCHVKPVQKPTGGSGAIPKKFAPKRTETKAKRPETTKTIAKRPPMPVKKMVPQEKFIFKVTARRATHEKAKLAGFSLGGFFQVQGQYLHIRTVVYDDYVSDGNTIICKQLVIDPQDTFPIFNSSGSEVVGAEPVHVQCHVLQPNVLSPFSSQAQVEATADKVFLVLASIPLQYPTGVGGTGYRQFGWNKTTTQITPSNEPAWVSVFNFCNTQLPKGAVYDVSDEDSNMVLGAIRVVGVDDFAQAEVRLQTRWSFEVRIPLPNLNLAKFAFLKVPGASGLDKIGDAIPLGYETALTEIKSIQRDRGGNSVMQAMAMADADEQADRKGGVGGSDDTGEDDLASEFEKLDLDVVK